MKEASIESLGKEVWKLSRFITESITKMIVHIFVTVYRANKTMHGILRRWIGEGLMALLFTALILQFCAIIYISCTMKITLERVLTAVTVDTRVALEAKKRGWL